MSCLRSWRGAVREALVLTLGQLDDTMGGFWFRHMNGLDGVAVLLEHAMLEFLGRIVVQGCVQRRRIDLINQLLKGFDVGFSLLVTCQSFWCLSKDEGEKGEEKSGGEDVAD